LEDIPVPDPTILHLSQQELANRWRVSPRTLERWRHVGGGPGYIKIGSRVAYPLVDIEGFEATHHVAADADVTRSQEAV
jgi:hypothetical protein